MKKPKWIIAGPNKTELRRENRQLKRQIAEINTLIQDGYLALGTSSFDKGYRSALDYIREGVTNRTKHPARQSTVTRRTDERGPMAQ